MLLSPRAVLKLSLHGGRGLNGGELFATFEQLSACSVPPGELYRLAGIHRSSHDCKTSTSQSS
jgi:hypothetical protein